jgi:hypothetical protein
MVANKNVNNFFIFIEILKNGKNENKHRNCIYVYRWFYSRNHRIIVVLGRSSDLSPSPLWPSHLSSKNKQWHDIKNDLKSLQHRVVLLNFTVFPFHLSFLNKKLRTPNT